ncbi:hypothetical protein EPD60_15075 [Flaviaesturariibacter flavus]|uniref:Matrixin family metalloprotease n=1 Tax=Flaviaesturariibacter flavus TaxID=2502780 RepID=A0A4R1B8S9_9BACT|nr:M57 family metalloprotease [Flaviaesturariibacter flavus]TCJ12589.1 hypothetical protein EPD60_15075 [Flaviaesturariibacter flavus]
MSNALFTKPSVLAFAALIAIAAPSCKKSDVAAPAESSVATPAAPAQVSNDEVRTLTAFVATSTGENNVTWDAAAGHFVIDNDAAMSLEDARGYYAQRTQGAQTEHRRSYYAVAPTKAPYVKVYADATVPAVWVAALDKAIANWNAAGSKLQITRVSANTTGAVAVKGINNGGNGVIATTYYPDYNSNPGKSCTINTYYNYLSAGQQVFAITHELGHAFGFGHTNSTYGTLVAGTPNTDGQSIMNSVCLTWSAFTTYDLLAIRTVYPR